MKRQMIYCYDVYCGWCYGFSPVVKRLAARFQDELEVLVLSGGMVLPDTPRSIAVTAPYIREAYKVVEAHTGIQFGQDYLWHIFNPEESDWFPHSMKPAIALCILKEAFPERGLDFAADLQYALNFEGRDLTDDAAYLHLLPRYGLDSDTFYEKLHSPSYEDQARHEFSMVRQLKVESFPALLVRASEQKFFLAAKGFTAYEVLEQRLGNILRQLDEA